MLISFIRTAVLLAAVVAVVRLMGKRQIGQLQPSELVVTILLSQVAAAPMQDNDIPMINTLAALAVLAGAEVLFSVLCMKSRAARQLLDGSPVILVRDGEPDQAQMRRLRYTLSDLSEALREKDVFDIGEGKYAVAETNGSVSVLLKAGSRAVTLDRIDPAARDGGMPFPLISDGEIRPEELRNAGCTPERLRGILQKAGCRAEDVFLLTMDEAGTVNLIRKQSAAKPARGRRAR